VFFLNPTFGGWKTVFICVFYPCKGFKNEKTKRIHGFEIINFDCSIGFDLPDVSCLSFAEGR